MNTASDMDGDFCLPSSGIWRDAHRRRWSVFRVSFFRNTFARAIGAGREELPRELLDLRGR